MTINLHRQNNGNLYPSALLRYPKSSAMLAAARRNIFSSSSSNSSSSSSGSTKSRRSAVASLLGRRSSNQGNRRTSNKSKVSGFFRKKTTRNAQQEHNEDSSVPIDIVRKLLMGNIDPVELARDILPHSDLAAVVRYNSAPYRPALDLDRYEIATVEDILMVGLTYVGFDGPHQDIRDEMNRERFCSHFKLCPETILDAWHYFNENSDDGIEFKRLLISLNFLKLCKYYSLFFVIVSCSLG